MSMRLITELNQDVEILTEARGDSGEKSYYITGPFLQAEQKNRNGRIYPLPIMEREVNRYVTEYVNQNRALGELGHPDGPGLNLERVSHVITELKKDGNDFIGKAKILSDQHHGKIVENFLKQGIKLGVSSRGVGSLKESSERGGAMVVQDNYRLIIGADIVFDPSAPDAFVNGIMEGKEWIWENGLLKEIHLEKAKADINEASKPINRRHQKKMFEQVFIRTLRNL